MNLITLKTFEPEQIASIIDTSIKIKQNPLKYEDVLKHKKMYMLFEKTSTRTSLGFGLGFNELGGTYFIQRWQDSNFAVGEIVDETRYVATNVDIIRGFTEKVSVNFENRADSGSRPTGC